MAKGGGDGWIAAKPAKKGGKVEEPKISKIPVTKVQVQNSFKKIILFNPVALVNCQNKTLLIRKWGLIPRVQF